MKNEVWVPLDDITRHLSYRWIDDRGLPAHKVGRLWKFKISEVDAWVRDGKAAEGGRRS